MSFFNRLFKFRIFVCNNTSRWILLRTYFIVTEISNDSYWRTRWSSLCKLFNISSGFFLILIIYMKLGINSSAAKFNSNTSTSKTVDKMVCYLRHCCLFGCKHFLLYTLSFTRYCHSHLCVHNFYHTCNFVCILWFA